MPVVVNILYKVKVFDNLPPCLNYLLLECTKHFCVKLFFFHYIKIKDFLMVMVQRLCKLSKPEISGLV